MREGVVEERKEVGNKERREGRKKDRLKEGKEGRGK